MKDIEGQIYKDIKSFLIQEGFSDVPVIRRRFLDLKNYFNKIVIDLHSEKFSRYYEKCKVYNPDSDNIRITEKYNKTAILSLNAYGSNLIDDRVLEALRRLNELFNSDTLINNHFTSASINICNPLSDISFSYDNQRVNAYSFDAKVNFPADIEINLGYIKKAPINVKTIPESKEINVTWEYKEE